MKHLRILPVLSVLLACLGTKTAFAAESKYITVPVFYVTNRATSQDFVTHLNSKDGIVTPLDANGYPIPLNASVDAKNPIFMDMTLGYHRRKLAPLKYLNERRCVDGVDYGSADVRIPISEQIVSGLTSSDEQLDWEQSSDFAKSTNFNLISTETNDVLEEAWAFDKFWEVFSKYRQNKDFILYVHGFNDDFEAGLGRAARLGASSHLPVLLFSWPAKSDRLLPVAYVRDAVNNEWSQNDFDRLMLRLAGKRVHDSINLVAHSMGNHLILRNLRAQRLAWKYNYPLRLFRMHSITMLSPDVDIDVLGHDPCDYILGSAKTNILVSDKDEVLKISGWFNHDSRAGERYSHPLESIQFYDFSAVGESPLGHGPPVKLIGQLIGSGYLQLPAFTELDDQGVQVISRIKEGTHRRLPGYEIAVYEHGDKTKPKTTTVYLDTLLKDGELQCRFATFDGNPQQLRPTDPDDVVKYFQKVVLVSELGQKNEVELTQKKIFEKGIGWSKLVDQYWTTKFTNLEYAKLSTWRPQMFLNGLLQDHKIANTGAEFCFIPYSDEQQDLSKIKGVSTAQEIDLLVKLSPGQLCAINLSGAKNGATINNIKEAFILDRDTGMSFDDWQKNLMSTGLVSYKLDRFILSTEGAEYILLINATK